MNNRTWFRVRTTIIIVSVILFAALLVWLSAALINAGNASEKQQLENVEQAVINGAVLCYSVEGVYPETLEYLKENYRLKYDEKKYLVHYRYVSADIRPTVTVFVNK